MTHLCMLLWTGARPNSDGCSCWLQAMMMTAGRHMGGSCRYGYSFGTAAADVWHKVNFEAMLYPGYTTYGMASSGHLTKCSLDVMASSLPYAQLLSGDIRVILRLDILSTLKPALCKDCWHCSERWTGYAVPPKVLHYGLDWKIGKTGYEFDKHWFYDFDALQVPALEPRHRPLHRRPIQAPPAPITLPYQGTAQPVIEHRSECL